MELSREQKYYWERYKKGKNDFWCVGGIVFHNKDEILRLFGNYYINFCGLDYVASLLDNYKHWKIGKLYGSRNGYAWIIYDKRKHYKLNTSRSNRPI